MQKRTLSKGEVIFREGEESNEAYRLITGEVEITLGTQNGGKTLARLAEGEIFGEMSLIDDKPRSATATALTDCEVEVFHEDNFHARVLGDPENLQRYLRALFDRLRATDALLQWHLNKSAPKGEHRPSVEAVLRAAPAPQPTSFATAGPARLHLTSTSNLGSGTDVTVTKIPFRIGRTSQGQGMSPLASNDLSVPDQKPYHVSRNHCVIERSGDTFLVRDLGSKVGTIVNGMGIGIPFDSFIAALKPGENTLILGHEAGPHQFRIMVT